jgi:hypothetical protein
VNILGSDNNVQRSYIIDMSILPSDDITDKITGTPTHKVHTWDSPVNSETNQSLISDNFMFTITHNGSSSFRVNRMRAYVQDQKLY